MKHLIFTFFTIFACINMTKAQVTISTSDLNGTRWQLAEDYEAQSKDYYEYTQGTSILHRSDSSSLTFPYYLSNTIPTKFDYSKVGVSTKGCYYVQADPRWGFFVYYSIKSFNKTTGDMVLKMESKEFNNYTYTFYLMPINKPRGQKSEKKTSHSEW